MEELDTASMPPRGDECACILCGAPFPMEEDNEDLRSHLASDHLNYRPVRCSICAVGFTLQSAFERHVDVVHRKYRDTWNAHPTTNHDEVLEATLESLVRLSLQQNWSGLNASTNLLVAAEDEYVNCGLCPDDAEVFPSSKSREDHVRTHVNKMRTVTKTAPMIGSKRTLRRRRSALHSFYVEYAKCFPDRLHADLLEEPPQAQKRPVGRRKKPAKWKLLAESLPTSSSPSEILPAEQQPSTAEREESGVRAATKSKRHRSLPKRFSEQSFYLPPSIDTSNTSSISNAVNVCYAPNTWGAWKPPKAQVKKKTTEALETSKALETSMASNVVMTPEEKETQAATVILERCDHMLTGYDAPIDQPEFSATSTLPSPAKKQRIGAIDEELGLNLQEKSNEQSTLLPVNLSDSPQPQTPKKRGRPRKKKLLPPSPLQILQRRKKRFESPTKIQNPARIQKPARRKGSYRILNPAQISLWQPEMDMEESITDVSLDVVNFTDDEVAATSAPVSAEMTEVRDKGKESKPPVRVRQPPAKVKKPPAKSKKPLAKGKKMPAKGKKVGKRTSKVRKRSPKSSEPLCKLCGERVARYDMFYHTVVSHLRKDLWKCSVCSFSSQLDAEPVKEHIASAHDGDEHAAIVYLLADYVNEVRAFIHKCFPNNCSKPVKDTTGDQQNQETAATEGVEGTSKSTNATPAQVPSRKIRCNQCRSLSHPDDLKAHVAMHLSHDGCLLYRCLSDSCPIRKCSTVEMTAHFKMAHPQESVSYLDESFLPEIQKKFKEQAERSFRSAIICNVCCDLVAPGAFAIDHAWGHMLDNDETIYRYRCLSCPQDYCFRRHDFLKIHLTSCHGAIENDEASLNKAKDDFIIDRMYKFERTFGLQWLTCFPDVRPIPDTEPFKTHPVKSPALQSNSNLPGPSDESAYCKLCSVSMPNDQAEKHIYWHIARMFSTCRYKCRICKMEDSDREQLAERCGNKHATSSTDEEFIEDQSRMSGSQLPQLFRACAEKCFNTPPASLSYHLTERSTGQPRTMTVTVLSQQGQLSNESPNTIVASPPPKLTAMGSDESQPPLNVKCRLCDERVAVGEEGTHGEVHLMVSGIWKRFGCGRCDFGAETSDEVELHYGKDHGVDFTEFYERSRPSGDEVDSMRRRCFSADQSTSDGVIDLTCEPIEEVICPKGDVSKQKSSVERSLTCAFCKTDLISDPYLHVHTIHMNKKRFDCIRCNKSYGTKEQLKAHITLVHTNIDIEAAVKQAFDRLQKRMSAFMQICFGIK